jgi:hypothetical protein
MARCGRAVAGTGFVPDAADDRLPGAERTRLVPVSPGSKEDHLMTGTWPRTLTGLTAALTLALLTSCGTPAPISSAAPQPAQSPPSRPASASSAAAPVWHTDPVTVRHSPAVPPVPVLTRIRYAGHPEEGYDRIVFDIAGGLPGYSARYVDEVRADGSGNLIAVPGNRYLLIVFTPMQAHRDSGEPTVTGTHRAGLAMLTSYAMAGDYEGNVSVALGLDARTGFRIGELPGRVYLDVAN